jgi:drug/metabolite transporter (DMT)-like permease
MVAEGFMRPYILMLWGAFAFACMGAFTHAAKDYCDWQVIAFARSGVALLIAGVLAFCDKSPLVFLRPWTIWVRSIAGSMSIMCNFYALSRLPIADALTLTNMFPIWIAVLSWPVLGRFPEREVWLSVLLAMTGVFVMQQPYLASGNLGTLAAVSGSFTSAVALIGLHRLKGLAANAIVFHFSAVSIVILTFVFVVFPASEHSLEQLRMPWPGPGLLLGVGLAATAGQLLLTRAFSGGAPARVSVIGLTQIGFAMVFDVLLWGRAVTLHSLIGILMIVGPSIWLMTRRAPDDTGEAT